MYDNLKMQKDIPNPITAAIRSVKRNDLKDLRNKQRENALCYRRLGLHDVLEHTQNVSLLQFKELLLNLRKKHTILDDLKKIKNSCVSYEYIETFFRNEGAFNCLISFLIDTDVQKQLEAAACLTNLICGSHKYSKKIAKASGVYLVSFISGNNCFLKDQSVWALGNIANDCKECFNIIKGQGALLALYKSLESLKSNIIQSIVFALNACTKYEDPEVISMIQSDLPKKLLSLLEQDDFHKSIFLDTAFTLSNCCFWTIKSSNNVDLEVIEKYIIILYKIIKTPDIEIMVSIPLVRCLGFLSYNEEVCKYISAHSSFYKSVQVIFEARDCFPLQKESIWVLCNIAASQATFCADLYLPLMGCVSPILKLENSATVQILYCLLCLISKKTINMRSLKQYEFFTQIQVLSSSERSDISNACKVFLKTIQCE